jgi:threonylcarbamoyladenosine tRNA methylthiotransferase MtaB
MTNRSAAYYTLGCKLNFAETSTISRQLAAKGYRPIDFEQGADVYVINTCSVTEHANRKCRNIINRALAINPEAFIVVLGCYAQLKPGEISELEGVDLVLGAGEKFKLADHLGDLSKKGQAAYHACDIQRVDSFYESFSLSERTRSFLKIQDGCDYNCSFCTIPLARGKSRSNEPENVLESARKLGQEGVREIVLTGINTGDFGKGLHGGRKAEVSFLDLIRELDKVEEVDRFRISSIEPNLLTMEIIDMVAASKRFVPHFHIPLQSGSNKILRAMRRRYQRELYAERVEQIKNAMPHACIGVDVITGFPGESEEDFLESYHFIRDLDLSYLHVFSYSSRPNTPAAAMPGQLSRAVKNERSRILRSLSEKKLRQFYTRHLGSTRPVLFEGKTEGGMISGYSDNYIKVLIPEEEALKNQILPVRFSELSPEGLMLGKIHEAVTL